MSNIGKYSLYARFIEVLKHGHQNGSMVSELKAVTPIFLITDGAITNGPKPIESSLSFIEAESNATT